MEKINWCFKIKNGLKLDVPNENLSNSYLSFAEKTLSKISDLINEKDYLWASVRVYYCSYYCIYAFLQRIGIKSENHDCSIEITKFLINEDFIKNIEIFKKNRIESQYYLDINREEELLRNYKLVKDFYRRFYEKINSLNDGNIKNYRNKIKEVLK